MKFLRHKPVIITLPQRFNIFPNSEEGDAIALYPFILTYGKLSIDIYRRESISFAQQKELFVIFFYMLYAWDIFKGFVKYKSISKANHRARFTQEINTNMFNHKYLDSRPAKNWKKYRV